MEFTKKEAILSLKINHEDMNRSFREISQGVRPKRGNINGFFEKQANLEQKKERYDCFREEKT